MLGTPRLLKTLPFAALLSATALQPALAWEAEEVAGRLKTLLETQGFDAQWSGARQDGDSVILEGFAASVKSVDKTIEFGDVELEDVSETDDTYEVGRVAMDHFERSDDGVDVVMNGLVIDGLMLPKEGADNPYGGMMQYRRFAVDDLAVGMGDAAEIFTLNDLVAEVSLEEDGGLLKFTGSADKFAIDLAAIAKDGNASEALKEYGYEQVSGRLEMDGDWNPEDGRMKLTRYDATIDNAGTLGVTVDISGYTPDFIKALQDIQAKMNAATEEQQQAQGLAMLGLMQQLNLHGASIRFSDASLTEKILSYVAKQQGVEPGDVANQAKAIVPLMAGQYLGPELTQSLSKATSAYLDNPKSLEISVAPAEPAPFAVLMGAAMGSPEALAKQLGLTVVAND